MSDEENRIKLFMKKMEENDEWNKLHERNMKKKYDKFRVNKYKRQWNDWKESSTKDETHICFCCSKILDRTEFIPYCIFYLK